MLLEFHVHTNKSLCSNLSIKDIEDYLQKSEIDFLKCISVSNLENKICIISMGNIPNCCLELADCSNEGKSELVVKSNQVFEDEMISTSKETRPSSNTSNQAM